MAANPERDTIRVYDSVVLRVTVPLGDAAPTALQWSVLPRGDSSVGDSFVFHPAGAGTELVRVVAHFAGGAVGTAERRFVVQVNNAPLASINDIHAVRSDRLPLGDTARFLVTISDPDGDALAAGGISWTVEPSSGVLLASGDTVRFVPDSAMDYQLSLMVTDPGGAFTRVNTVVSAYDPVTPARWRTGTCTGPRHLLETPGGLLVILHGNRDESGFSLVPTCQKIEAWDTSGVHRWELNADPAGQSMVVGQQGDIYLAQGEVRRISDAGSVDWVLPGNDFTAPGSTLGPAILADGSVVLPSFGNLRSLRRVSAGGAILWEVGLDSMTGLLPGVAVAADSTIYVGGRTASAPALAAVSAAGTLQWVRVSHGQPVPFGGLGPTIVDDSTILFGSTTLDAVRPDGSSRWSVPFGGPVVVGAADDVYVGTSTGLRALRGSDGSERWATTTTAGYLALAADGTLFATSSSFIIAYDATTGAELWRHRMAFAPSTPPLITAGGLLVVTDHFGIVEAIDIGAGPLDSPWPMAFADAQRSGRVRRP